MFLAHVAAFVLFVAAVLALAPVVEVLVDSTQLSSTLLLLDILP
jgi:archaellum component FlaG (FlaF/FlaG flagellin family)